MTNSNTNSKVWEYDVLQIDAWGNKEEGFTWNESWHIGEIRTKSLNTRVVFRRWLRNHWGLRNLRSGRMAIVDDGDDLILIDSRTERPLIACRPNFFD